MLEVLSYLEKSESCIFFESATKLDSETGIGKVIHSNYKKIIAIKLKNIVRWHWKICLQKWKKNHSVTL